MIAGCLFIRYALTNTGGILMQNRSIRYLFCVLVLCLLSGCGSKEETVEYQWVYNTQETAIPDAKSDLRQSGDLEGVQRIRYWSQTVTGNQVCQIMQLQYVTEENIEEVKAGLVEERADKFYLQRWSETTASWNNEISSRTDWFPDSSYESSLAIQKLAIGRDGELYCVFLRGEDAYLGCWRSDSKEILGKFPDEFLELGIYEYLINDYNIFVAGDGKLFFYSEEAAVILETDKDFSEIKRYPVKGSIFGMAEDPSDHQLYWYGKDDRGAGVWALDGHALVERFEELNTADYMAVFSTDGTLFLSNKYKFWVKEKDGEPEQVWNWRENGFALEKITDMTVGEEGELVLLTRYEGADQLVRVKREWGIPQEKQEVVLALVSYPDQCAMRLLIDSFNRQSRNTHVTVQSRDKTENYLDYIQNIQMEVSAGRGPDMLEKDMLNNGYIDNGYILSLDGKLEGLEGLLPAAVENGRYNGEVYGVPYYIGLFSLICSEEMAAGRSSWSVGEMMEAVRNSGAEMLHRGFSGSDIVYYFGLYDKDNRDYIDWEMGESHLNEEAFLSLLEFAEEYRDKGNAADRRELSELIQNGIVATVWGDGGFSGLELFQDIDNTFENGTAYIGFPKVNGAGIYVLSECICVNSNSQKINGCIEFLNYLISEAAQQKMSQYEPVMSEMQVGVEVNGSAQFNVRADILEEQIQNGVLQEKLTSEQGKVLYGLLTNAEPLNSPAEDISSMVYEELDPYFAGERTAKEAAEKLNNRVQLYLDERK